MRLKNYLQKKFIYLKTVTWKNRYNLMNKQYIKKVRYTVHLTKIVISVQ